MCRFCFTIICIICIFCSFGKQKELKDFSYVVELSVKKGLSSESLSSLALESKVESEAKKITVFSQRNKTVSSMDALTDRLNKGVKILYKNLHMLGYYNSKISYDIKVDKSDSAIVSLNVDAMNKFNLDLSIKFLDLDEKSNEYYLNILKEKCKHQKASMSEIRSAIDETLSLLKNTGFYNPQATKKKVFIDYEKETAVLNLEIICGKSVNFGDTEIIAFPGIDEQFILNRLKWNPGELFSQEKIDSSIAELKNTQIFSAVKIKPLSSDLKEKSLPIQVKVKEDKKNILDLSLMYQGVRNMNFEKKSQASKQVKSIVAKISWTRLNAFGGGEKVVLNAEGTPLRVSEKRIDYAFETILTQPDVFIKDSSMEYGAFYKQELTNVFFKKNKGFNFKYLFPISHTLFSDVGLILEHTYVDSDSIFFSNKNLSHYQRTVTIPVSLVWDCTDSLLNPSSGLKITLKGSIMKLSGAEINTLKFGNIGITYHHALDKEKSNVLSLNIHKKYIFGADIDRIPIDKRLYAGGINSVRGFANQLASERVKNTEITMGGKSIFEFNAELRRKINKDWGATVFFDGARVYGNRSKYSELEIEKKRWFFSIGTGIRYYTSIGPIRVDFAFPLCKRKNFDSRMQFMLGLGQAF